MDALCDSMDLAPEVESLASTLTVTPALLRPMYLDALGWATTYRRPADEPSLARGA